MLHLRLLLMAAVAGVLLLLLQDERLHTPRVSPSIRRRQQAIGRRLGVQLPAGNYETPDLTASISDRYALCVTGWDDLGVSHHMAVGTWGGHTYQISIWLRFPCSADASKREVRLVIQLNLAPVRKLFLGFAEVVPKELLVGGKLPGISFRTMDDRNSSSVLAEMQYWDQLINDEVRTPALVGHATLEAGRFYQMEIEGSERVFQLEPKPCSSAQRVFGSDRAWLTLGGRSFNTDSPDTFAFLIMQYVDHHMRLGFAGLALVVTPHVATGLLAHDRFVDMVKQRHVVLLSWDFSFDPTMRLSFQMPAQNLLAMAMHGTQNFLGMWDVDEYLVLPGHQPIMHEITQGCLKEALEREEEAVVPFELATIDGWQHQHGEIAEWKKHGSFAEAAKHVNYTTRAYPHCNGGCLCKSLLDTNTDRIVQGHELQKQGPGEQHIVVPRSCAHMLHFFNLWRVRSFDKCWLNETGLGPRAPLKLEGYKHHELRLPGSGGLVQQS